MAQNKLPDMQNPAARDAAAAASPSAAQPHLPTSPWGLTQPPASETRSSTTPPQAPGKAERHTKQPDLLKKGKRLAAQEGLALQTETDAAQSQAQEAEEPTLAQAAAGSGAALPRGFCSH